MANLADGFGPMPTAAPTERLPTFDLPHSISVFEYPRYIRDFEKHVNRLRRSLAEEESLRDARHAFLHGMEWHGMGTNDKIRDSRFKVRLLEDDLYQQHERVIANLFWHIKTEQTDLDKLTSESINARLRYRSNIVATELFAGVPIDPEKE